MQIGVNHNLGLRTITLITTDTSLRATIPRDSNVQKMNNDMNDVKFDQDIDHEKM